MTSPKPSPTMAPGAATAGAMVRTEQREEERHRPLRVTVGRRGGVNFRPALGGQNWTGVDRRVSPCSSRGLRLRWEEQRLLDLGHLATYWELECAPNNADPGSLAQCEFG
jgi:hypothetical protein